MYPAREGLHDEVHRSIGSSDDELLACLNLDWFGLSAERGGIDAARGLLRTEG